MIDVKNLNEIADINILLSYYGLKPNRAGFINCFAHKEKTPSMKVYPRTNSVHCFGCGADFNSIGIVMFLENCNFLTACEKIKYIFNIKDFNKIDYSDFRKKIENEKLKKQQEKLFFDKQCKILRNLENFYYKNLNLENDDNISFFANLGYVINEIEKNLFTK